VRAAPEEKDSRLRARGDHALELFVHVASHLGQPGLALGSDRFEWIDGGDVRRSGGRKVDCTAL
jgi:hypothetical protein